MQIDIDKVDLPAGVVIECFEVFAGALLQLVPGCFTVEFIIGDGSRRIFNELEASDNESKNEVQG